MAKVPSSKLGIGRDSRVISKFKPKIRIIHIYAPEIIKTDAANFRELVQRLTGKPEDEDDDEEQQKGRNKSKVAPRKHDLHPNKAMMMIKNMEEEEENHEKEFQNLQNGKGVMKIEHDDEEEEEVKGNDDIWRKSKSNEKMSVFLDEFSDLDGFMEELSALPVVDQN